MTPAAAKLLEDAKARGCPRVQFTNPDTKHSDLIGPGLNAWYLSCEQATPKQIAAAAEAFYRMQK